MPKRHQFPTSICQIDAEKRTIVLDLNQFPNREIPSIYDHGFHQSDIVILSSSRTGNLTLWEWSESLKAFLPSKHDCMGYHLTGWSFHIE